MLKELLLFAMIVGAAGSSAAQSPAPACTLPAAPQAIAAAIDAAISGPADKDRSCMQQLFLPEAHLTIVAEGANGELKYSVLTLDDWIARVKVRGSALLEEKQVKFSIDSFGGIAHLWSTYVLHSDGKQVARGINSIQAVKVGGGWRVSGILWQAESATLPLPKEVLP
ncbi:MAG TPA: nuclear transport factor 2 family protein [Steroidobacteraceae bacterium]|jgi:hypothetical protein